MATIVKGDLYERLEGKLYEIKRQIRQKEGYGFDPERLDLALQAITEGRFEAVGVQFPSLIYVPELILNGWSVAIINGVPQDVAPSQFDVGKLKPRSFLRGRESLIGGEEMRKRAPQFKANIGLSDGKRLLAEQDKIPPEFRGFYIPLPDTLLRGSDGSVHVPDLYFHGARWYLSFRWLGRDWDGRGRFACSE